MKQIKKTILTLVALFAVTTGAWADDQSESFTTATNGQVTYTGEHFTITGDRADTDGFWIGNAGGSDNTVTISSRNGENITKIEAVLSYVQNWGDTKLATTSGEVTGTYDVGQTITISSVNATTVTLSGPEGEFKLIEFNSWTIYYGDAPTAVTVDWNKATKTGTFTMPGGNVELEPEYYPQAALTAAPTAINDVPATTDGAIVNAGTVANIDGTTTAQGTVMYYVSTTALDDAALLALAADAWTADVPTAESFTAAGEVHVYYYVRGNDSDNDDEIFSDGDILSDNALTVTIAAAPTYAVTFAEGTDPNEWTASPNTNVTKGQTVTVTYTGSKKVIGVKAEKKAPVVYTMVSEATAEDIGKVICDKGHLHDAKTAVPTGCTAVGILGKVTGDGHGLILAMQDATQQNWNTINGWTSVDTYAGTTLKVLPAGALGNLASYTTLGETAVSNWAVAQKSDYDAIFQNLGSTQHDQDGYTYDGNVNDYITTGVGGTAISDKYWSATRQDGNWAYDFESEYWNVASVTGSLKVRPVLGF